MSAITEMLNRIFRPAHVLLVDSGKNDNLLADTLLEVCACELERYKGGSIDDKYDVIFVDTAALDAETLSRLKTAAPVVLVGRPSHLVESNEDPLLVMPKVSKHAVADMFRVLRIKMRTPDVVASLKQMADSVDSRQSLGAPDRAPVSEAA